MPDNAGRVSHLLGGSDRSVYISLCEMLWKISYAVYRKTNKMPIVSVEMSCFALKKNTTHKQCCSAADGPVETTLFAPLKGD